MLETLIDEAPLRPIITPPNKATCSDTNNLVPTQTLIKLLEKFFFALKGFSNQSHTSIPSHPTIIKQSILNNFVDFNNIPSFVIENQIILFNSPSLECDAFQQGPYVLHTLHLPWTFDNKNTLFSMQGAITCDGLSHKQAHTQCLVCTPKPIVHATLPKFVQHGFFLHYHTMGKFD